MFQEVVSQSLSVDQPLGTLAGKGHLANVKGGNTTVKFDEISYLMGICSITPRLDYSQGTKWDMMLDTWDDVHKPAFDAIGFQELPTQELAWWSTEWDQATTSWPIK